ncbi:hypothetical protein GCM10029992_07780 [Glycomyces albus]
MLVTDSGGAILTGFDYARPEAPRDETVLKLLADHADPHYTAPECLGMARAATVASDVYSAGTVAYRLLAGELPFATVSDRREQDGRMPDEPLARAGVASVVASLLKRMCAFDSRDRPTSSEALRDFENLMRRGTRKATSAHSQSGDGTDYRNLPPDHQLTRKFTVRDYLGEGSFSVVYRVFDNLSRMERAVKIIDRDRESNVDRLVAEYQHFLRMEPHPAIVKVFEADYLRGSDVPYLVLEYLDGKTADRLAQSGDLNPADVIDLGTDAASGLEHLHEAGIYHLDIKPDNLFKTDSGYKIIDLNVAASADSSLSRLGGTDRYLPPTMASTAGSAPGT